MDKPNCINQTKQEEEIANLLNRIEKLEDSVRVLKRTIIALTSHIDNTQQRIFADLKSL